jgi:tetratricopeptide (TPR) repeat protein
MLPDKKGIFLNQLEHDWPVHRRPDYLSLPRSGETRSGRHGRSFPGGRPKAGPEGRHQVPPRGDHQLGFVYLHIGLLDKGWQEIEKALAINPGNSLARYRLGVIDMCRGKYEEALQIFISTPMEKSPSLLAFYTSTALFRLGRNQEASAIIEQFLKSYPNDEGGLVTSVKAMMLAKAGKHREAEDTIRRATEIGRGYAHFHHTSYSIASTYALMNQPEDAIKWLQVTAEEGFPCYPLFEGDTNLDSLRQDPRFISFMAEQKQQWEHFGATL